MSIFAQRLLNAARAVRESSSPHRFDMGVEVHECGTPACVFGHYAYRADLQEEFTIDRPARERGRPWTMLKVSQQFVWWDSREVRQHFGLDETEAKELFFVGGCGNAGTPGEAAAYIEKFVARKWPATCRNFARELVEHLATTSRISEDA